MGTSSSKNFSSNKDENKQNAIKFDISSKQYNNLENLNNKILNGCNELKNSVSEINSELIKANFNQMKSDISSLKQGCNELKNSVSDIKSEIANSNFNQMKSDISTLNKGCAELKNNVSDINAKINNANFNQMKSDILSLKTEVVEIKNLLLLLIQNNQHIFSPSNQNININNPQKKLNEINIFPSSLSETKNNNNILDNINKPIDNNPNNNKLDNKINIIKIQNIQNIPIEKQAIISMNGKDISIKIKSNITLVEFKSIVKKHFFINDYTNICYFNQFGVKKYIKNELDFKNSLNQKTLKYYFSDNTIIINNKQNLISYIPPQTNNSNIIKEIKTNDFQEDIQNNQITNNNNLNNPKFKIIFDNPNEPSQNYNFINSKNNQPNNINNQQNLETKIILSNEIPLKSNEKNNNNINNQIPKHNNEIKLISQNNFFKPKISEKKDIESYKQEVKDVTNHFASMAFIPGNIDKGDFINSAVYLSHIIKKINIQEKLIYPYKFHDSKVILKYPGLISSTSFGEPEKLFILSLICDVLEEKGINVSIYKKTEDSSNIDGASLQYLFNGFTEKKKYEIQFNLDDKENDILLQKGDELNTFIDEWKTKISNQLKIDKSEIFLVNPQDNNGLCLDLVTDEYSINYNKLKNFNEIKNIQEKSLIEGCQLNTDIFAPEFNNQDPGWGKNETRGEEEYIPPEGWFGFGLKVGKKYDNGDVTWLDYNDREGVFAVAYLGLSNIYGNKKNLNNFLNEINSQEVLKMGYEQTYKNDINTKKKSLKEYPKCGKGVYLYQNPKIAENTASIIDIGGVRYKILLMCRVNPYKIRQPQGFKDCWILNPTPSEVRPYRILIKKIFQSPMSGASQNEIKTFESSPDYYKDIINKKDTSFFSKNLSKYNNDDYVINLYTSNDYWYINNYLREGKIPKDSKYSEEEIKSWAYCLHNSLTNRKSNVLNSSTFYRGVNRKFPNDLGIGSKFIFSEFISVSDDKSVALSFAAGGTLFIVRIENNNNSNYYCYNIQKLSKFPHEKEILITSNCTFQITKKDYNDKDFVDEVYLTCEGYKANDSLNKDIKKMIKLN